MQIIWNSEVAERMRGTHTVLELETFRVQDRDVTTYCVVPPEKIGINGFASLETYKTLHEGFIKAMKENDAKLCQDISEHLMGQFGGELDTFYEEILNRFHST
jgi:hypothetical protein